MATTTRSCMSRPPRCGPPARAPSPGPDRRGSPESGNWGAPRARRHCQTAPVQRFWSYLGLELGKRAGLVSVVGLVITVVLGLGITQLEFATGQDSYLNKDEEV